MYSNEPLRQEKNGCHFGDFFFKCILLNENFCILINIPLKRVVLLAISRSAHQIQVMAWCETGAKPLPKSMMTLYTDVFHQDWVNT